jgi:hypothetical protein
MYLVLVTNKSSNILEDLETLRLCGKVVPEYVDALEEEEVSLRADGRARAAVLFSLLRPWYCLGAMLPAAAFVHAWLIHARLPRRYARLLPPSALHHRRFAAGCRCRWPPPPSTCCLRLTRSSPWGTRRT